MKFEEALVHLREGKKIAISGWAEGNFITFYRNEVHDEEGNEMTLDVAMLDSKRWVIYEEPKKMHECYSWGKGFSCRTCKDDYNTLLVCNNIDEERILFECSICPFCGYSPEKKSDCNDKTSTHYFMCHMTQEEFDKARGDCKIEKYSFNKIKKEPKTMNFAEAMKLLMEGKKVGRGSLPEGWKAAEGWQKPTTGYSNFWISAKDIEATDWAEVIE